jgi:hypothetical protein
MTLMIETAILEKVRRLPKQQQQEVLNFTEFLEAKVESISEKEPHRLAQAALALLADYETDAELTAFTALDGEPFHA